MIHRPFGATLKSRLSQAARDSRGTAALEFAIVSMPFLALVIAILQIGLVFYAGQVLETGVEAASRSVLTGQAQSQGLTQAQYANTVCAKLNFLFNCSNLMIDMQTVSSFSGANTGAPTLTYDGSGNVTNTWQYQTGGSGSIVVLRVMYQWPLVFGPLAFNLSNLSNGKRLLMATSVFKNEPYQ